MLRRFRKRPEYNEVDCKYQEEFYHDNVDGDRPRAPQHELLHEQQQQQLEFNRIEHVPSTYHLANQDDELTRDASKVVQQHSNSNLLNSIHVQVIPPSSAGRTVTNNKHKQQGRHTQKSLEKLNRLSAEEARQSPLLHRDYLYDKESKHYGGGSRGGEEPTASTRSSTRNSSHSTIITSDSRKLWTKACHQLLPEEYCTPCLSPFHNSAILPTVSTEDSHNSIFESRFTHGSSVALFGVGMEEESLLSREVDSRQSEVMKGGGGCTPMIKLRHAHAYHPNPPRRRYKPDNTNYSKMTTGISKSAPHERSATTVLHSREENASILNNNAKLLSVANAQALLINANANAIDRTQSAEVRESAVVRGRDRANAEFISMSAFGKLIPVPSEDESVNDDDDDGSSDGGNDDGSLDDYHNDHGSLDESGFDHVEMQLTNNQEVEPNVQTELMVRDEVEPKRSRQLLSESLSDQPESLEEAKNASSVEEDQHQLKNRETKTPNAMEAQPPPSLQNKQARKLPFLLRAISPMQKSQQVDPVGLPVKEGEKHYPILPKPNIRLRRAPLTHPKLSPSPQRPSAPPNRLPAELTEQQPFAPPPSKTTKPFKRSLSTPKQQRSPSPRRPLPPADRLSPAEPTEHPSNIRGLRRSPSPTRDQPNCSKPDPTASSFSTDSRGVEPQSSTKAQEPLASKFRRALTPKRRSPTPSKRRFFSRNGSAARQRREGDPPPDPPGSPSWKVGGTYSPRRSKRQNEAKRRLNNGLSNVSSQPAHMKRDVEPQNALTEQAEPAAQPVLTQAVQAVPEVLEKQSGSQERNVSQTRKKKPQQQQQMNPHQRRNYQQYVMMQKQKSRRAQSQKDQQKKQASTEPLEPQVPQVATRDNKQRQIEQEVILEKTNVQYQIAESSKSKNLAKSSPTTQPPEPSRQNADPTQNLKDPVQLKKVLSSPSVMMSTLTSQTMNTTNTTTTSKFWDGVEGYQPSSHANPITPPDRNVSFETGLHGNPKKFDNITEEDVVILKKLNEKNKELQEFFQVHKIDESGQRRALQSRTPPRTKMEAQLTPASPNGSAMESAFSLNLPMNKMGYFDGSDISALAMGDSATVYHMRASAEAKMNSSDYWREKYEKLKEETRKANRLRGMNEVLLEEDEDNFLRMEKSKKGSSPRSSSVVKKTSKGFNVVDEDQSQFLQQQKLLLHCGGYMGGKKAKGIAANNQSVRKQSDSKHQKKKVEPKRPAKSIFSRAQCFMPDEEGNSFVESVPEPRDQREITRRVSSEEEIETEKLAKRLKCTRLVVDDQKIQSERHVVPDVEVIANRLQCDKVDVDNQVKPDRTNQLRTDKSGRQSPHVHVISETFTMNDDALNTSRPESSLGFESLNSDLRPLQPIGYVQRLKTPSPHPNQTDESPEEAPDALNCYNDPMYVMDDADALKEWNKNRQPKALADELSNATSRDKASSADGSELSEGAKLIFEAALKYDIKALREQRSRSTSRTPTKMRRASPVQSFHVSATSALSENFASNIPQDYASWFELPSPGTSCITLIPMLKGHLRNAVVVELLSAFDGASHKTDAKGVHRISPRHRVSDTLQKSFTEYLDSPAIASKTSMDSEYMGPIIADGEDGSIRFADASIHLGGISDAATSHIKKREFQDAIDIYSTLLRSLEIMSGWLVEQLIASTIHNLCVLHIWNEAYDLALPFAKECIRLKMQGAGDNFLLMHSWANVGLIHYALEAHSSAVMAFRNAVDISEGIAVDREASLTGRLQNNLGCVNVEIGNIEGALFEFEQSLQCQKENTSSNDADTQDADNLLSISITIFNIGATCARQKHYQTALKHTEAAHAMQEALLGTNSDMADNTLFYLNLLRKVVSSSQSPDSNTPKKVQTSSPPESSPSRAITRKDEVLDILDVNPESPERRIKQALVAEADHQFPTQTKRNEISYPMISLGSLKVEATAVERVRECLDRYDNSRNSTDRRANASIGRSLLCRKPPHGTKQPGIPSKLMNFGVKTLRKLEVQTELNDNLERYGPRHPLVGQSHHSLGLVLLCIENYEESIDHFNKSIRINTHALGSKHPDIASSLMFMALAQFALERYDDAAASMLQVRHIRESELGTKHNEIYQIMNNLACVRFELGSLKQAESLLQEALDLQREIFRTEPEFLKGVSTVLFNIAFVHAKNGAFPKALIELEGALQIRQDILFEDATTGDITENMAYILAIHQLQNGSGNIDDITNEYISMLQKK